MDESVTQRLDALENKLNQFLYEYNRNNNPTQQTFTKKCSFVGGTSFNNSSLGSTGDLMSVYGETPVAQNAAITAPPSPSATYVQAEQNSIVQCLNNVRIAIQNFGITQ